MKDNEIIKALECCAEHPNCKDCPCVSKTGCVNLISKDALDLLKRQRSEIENLKRENSLVHMLLKNSWQSIERKYTLLDNNNFIPEPCRNCTNHPSNGGDGNCNCILGTMVFY